MLSVKNHSAKSPTVEKKKSAQPAPQAGNNQLAFQLFTAAGIGAGASEKDANAAGKDSFSLHEQAHRHAETVTPARSAEEIRAKLSTGHPLAGHVRSRMERGFGRSLGQVQIHTEESDQRLASSLSARAFSVGSDVAFAAGQYRPGTLYGDALLAHELAHTAAVGEGGGEFGAERGANAAMAGVVHRLWMPDAIGPREEIPPATSSSSLQLRRCDGGGADIATPSIVDEAEMQRRGYFLVAQSGEMVLGRTYELQVHGRLRTGPAGSSDQYGGAWAVTRPGATESEWLPWSSSSRTFTLDAAGQWTFRVFIRLGENEYGVLSNTVTVRDPDAVAQAQLSRVQPVTLPGFLARLQYQDILNTQLGVAEQNYAQTYITLTGDNPASQTWDGWNTYTVHPPSGVSPTRYQWSAVPDDLSRYPTENYHGAIRRQVQGHDGFDLGTRPTAHWSLYLYGVTLIYCAMFDAQGAMVAEAVYRQVVLTSREWEQVSRFRTYMEEAREELRKLRDTETEHPIFVPAAHIATETGTATELSLFIGPPASGSGLKIIDVTPGIQVREFDGANFQEVLDHFNRDSTYPPGQIRLRIPDNTLGIPAREWIIQTSGASMAQRLSTVWGWESLGLAGLGVLAAVVPGAQPLAPAFFLAAAGLGAASAGASLYQHSQEAHPSGLSVAIDIAALAGSLLGMAGAANVLRVGPRVAALTRVGRFVLYAGFATDALGGVFIAVEGAEQIAAILDGPGSTDSKSAAITRILAGMLLNGALLAWGAHDLAATRRQIGQALGEAVTARLSTGDLHALSVLEGPAMARLAGASVEEIQAVAGLVREDPVRASQLLERYGERFVTGARAGPENLEELAQTLAAGGTPVGGTRGSYGPAAPGAPRPAYQQRAGDSSPGNLANRISTAFNPASPTRRILAEGATLRPVAGGPVAGGVQTRYELVIPASGSRAEMVIPVRIESTAALPTTSIHGAEAGPARMEIRSSVDTSGARRYEASIEVHRDLARSDVRHAVGHELDELISVALSGVSGAGITAQKRASLLRARAAGGTVPPVTAHDQATAREFADFARTEAPQGGRPPNFAMPDSVLERAVSMGFGGTAFLEDRLALLRTMGVDEDMLRRLRVMANRAEVAAAIPIASPLATPRVVGHALNPSGGTPTSPVGGLHLDSALAAYQSELTANNRPVQLVRTADSPRTVGGVTYNAYEQWRWRGTGAPPAGSRPTAPAGTAGATVGGWVLAQEAKTTFNNLRDFMIEAQGAWDAWRTANPLPATGSNQFWQGAAGPGRQQVAGFFNVTPAGVEMISVFPYRTGGVGAW